MLLSDGSVTRHLQLLTDLPVQVVSSAVLGIALPFYDVPFPIACTSCSLAQTPCQTVEPGEL